MEIMRPAPSVVRRSRLLALSFGLAGALLAPAAGAVSLTLTDGSTNYQCTLGSLGIASSGDVSATISGCSPTLGGGSGGVSAPAGPVTVNSLTTTDTTPTVQGGVTLSTGETFTVTIGTKTYTVGDGNLTVSGTAWTLQVPGTNELAPGTYNVTAKITNAEGGVLVDSSTNELVITSTSSSGDPGYGSGTWQPAGTSNVFVVDQSGADGAGGATIMPGCVNGGSLDYYAPCRNNTSYETTVNGQKVSIRLSAGQVLSVRYRVNAQATTADQTGYFQLSNLIGGNIVANTTISLSSTPGEFAATNNKCQVTDTRRPRINTGANYCAVDRSKGIYYVNVRVNQECKECVFTLGENSSELY